MVMRRLMSERVQDCPSMEKVPGDSYEFQPCIMIDEATGTIYSGDKAVNISSSDPGEAHIHLSSGNNPEAVVTQDQMLALNIRVFPGTGNTGVGTVYIQQGPKGPFLIENYAPIDIIVSVIGRIQTHQMTAGQASLFMITGDDLYFLVNAVGG